MVAGYPTSRQYEDSRNHLTDRLARTCASRSSPLITTCGQIRLSLPRTIRRGLRPVAETWINWSYFVDD